MIDDKKTANEVEYEKRHHLLYMVAYWGSYYRENPHRFVKDFLNITLKLFQKINIYEMMHNNYFMYIASRGQGKTWLIALFCVVRCILFPGTKIVVASGVKSQAIEVISKIKDDFLKNYSWGSNNLSNEISEISTSINNPHCDFKNGSYIHVVVSNDNARSNRANIIIIDEFRMVDKNTIDTVLRKFLTAPRHPAYLEKKEYAHLQERNCEIYASSAWYKSHWSYEKMKSYVANMLDDKKKYFVVALPYQIAIKENLLSREQVEDEMSEEDFDEFAWLMEMQCLFYGATTNAFFGFDDIFKQRKIDKSFLPLEMYEKRGLNVPELSFKERRIMSVDVALMASKRHLNDAAAIWINVAIPSGNIYQSNYVYLKTFEGLTTDELGIIIMRYFYRYNCTDLVLDVKGNGLGVLDFIVKEHYDPETGETYEAMTSCNNQEMADRCKVKGANKVVWCINASADFNSKIANGLRTSIKNGNINFLKSEFDIVESIKKISGYKSMSASEKAELEMPYIQTSLAVNEMVNLEFELVNNNTKLKERSGMRKDRYSSLAYNNYVVSVLNNDLKPKNKDSNFLSNVTIRPAKLKGFA